MPKKKKTKRSAIIPFHITENEIQMLFMKPADPKYGGATFQIAKGKHEDGESAEEAGLREGQEELGLFRGNIDYLHELGKFLGRTDVFVAKITDPDMFGEPHFETDETRWMTPKEFHAEGRDLHKPVVKAAVRFIEQKEEL